MAIKETRSAIKELCEAFTMLAKRKGPCLLQDVLLAFRAADHNRKEIEFDEENMTWSQKTSLFQHLYFYVVSDVVQSIREQMQRELMGAKGFVAGLVKTGKSSKFSHAKGFVAGLVKTGKSSKFYTEDPVTGEVKEQFISSASYSSLANAIDAKVMGRDLVAAHTEELKGENTLHHFLPPWAHILTDNHAPDLDEFLGIEISMGGALQLCKKSAPYRGF